MYVSVYVCARAHARACSVPGAVQHKTCPTVHAGLTEIYVIQSGNCYKEKYQYFSLAFRDTVTYTTNYDGDSSNKHVV